MACLRYFWLRRIKLLCRQFPRRRQLGTLLAICTSPWTPGCSFAGGWTVVSENCMKTELTIVGAHWLWCDARTFGTHRRRALAASEWCHPLLTGQLTPPTAWVSLSALLCSGSFVWLCLAFTTQHQWKSCSEALEWSHLSFVQLRCRYCSLRIHFAPHSPVPSYDEILWPRFLTFGGAVAV